MHANDVAVIPLKHQSVNSNVTFPILPLATARNESVAVNCCKKLVQKFALRWQATVHSDSLYEFYSG